MASQERSIEPWVSEGEVDEPVRRLRLTLEDTWDWVRGTF
ncbi:MAG: hypothetical protein K0S35_928 [Geminicoccaceae bacterium]|nr:hypothetical protein [Geminicoccaceae bacterium]